MTRLNQLKSGTYARIVDFENCTKIKYRFISKGINEKNIIRVISHIGLIVFRTNKTTFTISKNIAKHIRVVKIEMVS